MEKADDKFTAQDKKGKTVEAPFTNFQYLARRVTHLTDIVNEQAEILKQHGIHRKVDPTTFDEQNVFYSFIESPIAEAEEASEDSEEEPEEEAEVVDAEDDEEDDEEEAPKPAKKKVKKKLKAAAAKKPSESIDDELSGIIDDADDDEEEEEDEEE